MPHDDETALLLSTARARLGHDAVTAARGLLDRTDAAFDWGFVIDQAYRHNVLALVGRNILRHRLHPALRGEGGHFRYEELFRNAYHANQVRNEALARELVVILGALAERDVRPVVRKGAVLGQEVFGDVGVRRSYDIDLAVERNQVRVVEEVMSSLGYQVGNLAGDRRVIEPRSRRQELYWATRIPNRIFHRPTGERFVTTYTVDLSLNLFLPGSGYDLPSTGLEVRSRPIRLFGAEARAFTHEEMVIDLTTHLFKEATSFQYMRLGKDLTLAKFLDVATYVETQPVDWAVVGERVSNYQVGKPLFYALHYTDMVYPGSVPAEVLDRFRVSEDTFLREIGHIDQDVRTWHDDFIARLFDNGRAADLPPLRVPL